MDRRALVAFLEALDPNWPDLDPGKQGTADRTFPEYWKDLRDRNNSLFIYRWQPAWIGFLTTDEATGRRIRAAMLGRMGPGAAAAVPRLVELLDDPECRLAAIEALRSIGAGKLDSVPADKQKQVLLALVRSPDEKQLNWALTYLDLFGRDAIDGVPAKTLLDLVTMPTAYSGQKASAMAALARKGPSAVPLLVNRLSEESNAHRATMILETLGMMGPAASAAIPALAKRAADPRALAHSAAASALSKIRQH